MLQVHLAIFGGLKLFVLVKRLDGGVIEAFMLIAAVLLGGEANSCE